MTSLLVFKGRLDHRFPFTSRDRSDSRRTNPTTRGFRSSGEVKRMSAMALAWSCWSQSIYKLWPSIFYLHSLREPTQPTPFFPFDSDVHSLNSRFFILSAFNKLFFIFVVSQFLFRRFEFNQLLCITFVHLFGLCLLSSDIYKNGLASSSPTETDPPIPNTLHITPPKTL